jgi:hypothetical protein
MVVLRESHSSTGVKLQLLSTEGPHDLARMQRASFPATFEANGPSTSWRRLLVDLTMWDP